jgi:antitoxin MazE
MFFGDTMLISHGISIVSLYLTSMGLDVGILSGYTWYIQRGECMVTKIQKWGNSQGLRLARQILEDACISVGDDVEVAVREGVIVIAPVRRIRGRQSLQELVARMPKNSKPEETDWGKPVGHEAW